MAQAQQKLQDTLLVDFDQLCREIAHLHYDNADVIQRYHWIQKETERLIAVAEKKHGEGFASRKAIDQKISEWEERLASTRTPRKVGGKTTQRISPSQKIRVIKAMLGDFLKHKKPEVTMADINAWTHQPRQQGHEDIRDELGLRGLRISQFQWFSMRLGTINAPLYPASAYVSKSAPFPSLFRVAPWLSWLNKNEARLLKLIGKRNEKARNARHDQP
jgi:hypothetical protein